MNMIRIKSPRDFASAVTFLLIGFAGLWFSQDYSLGTAARMGPGYFPTLVSGLLMLLGLIVGIGSLRVEGPAIAAMNWRSIGLIVAAIIVFGLLIERAGVVVAIIVSATIAAFATREVRTLEAVGLAVFLAALCVVLFIYALGQPLPLFGGR
jgi:hypothetical protein